MLISVLALIAQFYVALYPVGGPNLDTSTFFQLYLAGPLFIFLYVCWKTYSWFVRPADRPLFIRLQDIDIYTGMREEQAGISGLDVPQETRRASVQEMQQAKRKQGVAGHAKAVLRNVF